MHQAPIQQTTHFGLRDIAVLVLSILVLAAIAVQSLFQLDPDVETLLDRIDFFICIFFLVDFAIRFKQAPSKLAYMKWGWIDLISSIPVWDPLRWGRGLRVVRILRILRALRSGRHLVRLLYRNRAKATIATAALAVAVLIVVASVSILLVEREPTSTIKTPFDAVWWAVSTITTVGYGDQVPVTTEGKIIAMVLMVAGIALFGVFTGLFARLMIESEEKDDKMDALMREIRAIREEISEVRRIETSSAAHPPRQEPR